MDPANLEMAKGLTGPIGDKGDTGRPGLKVGVRVNPRYYQVSNLS